MKKLISWMLFFVISSPLISSARTSETELLISAYWEASPSRRETTKQQLINASKNDVNKLYQWLKQGPSYRNDVPRGIQELHRTAKGGVKFPYVIVIPETYDAQRPIAVEFMLHGGVSRRAWKAGGKWWENGKHYSKYLQQDQITVFPAAWRDAVWWSDEQADNLSSILRTLKTTYNIDDNRVYLSGASDGGTGAYFFAFKQPSEWAAFLPYIGHMAVLTLKDEPRVSRIDIENLVNSSLFIVNGEKDPLYPAKSVAPYIRILEQSNINHVYTMIKNGGHDLKWLKELQPKISTFKQQHVRDPLPEKVRWITDRVDRYQRIHWIKIDKLKHHRKPGWISALRKGNQFVILTEDISRFRLLLNPDEVDFNQPILVTLNGKRVFDSIVSQDINTLLNWANQKDSAQLFTAELALDPDTKDQAKRN